MGEILLTIINFCRIFYGKSPQAREEELKMMEL